MKICFAASSGGHFQQLMRLRPLMDKYDGFIVTEEAGNTGDESRKTYYLKQVNRKEKDFVFKLIKNRKESKEILIREKPDAVICTGVLAMIPLMLIAKRRGILVIYIESFAKVNTPTLTGKLMYHFADYFFVQWESMKTVFPKAIYKGGLY